MTYEERPTILDEVDFGSDEDLEKVAFTLYRKAIRYGTWDPQAIDLSVDREQVRTLDPDLYAYLLRFTGAFYRAEENVALQFCPWVMAAKGTWQQAFLSTQLVEEFKHTEFFDRYFREVFARDPSQVPALRNPVHDSLEERATRIRHALDRSPEELEMAFVEGLCQYQGIIEGIQAMTGYGIFHDVFARKGLLPGLSQAYRFIQQDEGRHVGFGLRALRHFARKDPRYARRIREVFAEYLPLIRARYGQTFVTEDGREVAPPPEERGVERLMTLYERRLADIFQ